MSQIIELKVPDIGGHSHVDVIEVFVQVGQTLAVDDSLITLETDKATMEVPAESAGVVKEVRVAVGGKVSEGDVIALVEVGATAADTAAAAKPEATPVAATPVAAPVAAPVATAASSQRSEIRIPDIGGHHNVDVIEVAVNVGDEIKVDDSLITLETDKATMEVPATAAGKVVAVQVKVGDKVNEGDVIVVVESAAAVTAATPVVAHLWLRLSRHRQARQKPCRCLPQYLPRQQSMKGVLLVLMPALQCVNWHVNWALTYRKSKAVVAKGGLWSPMSKPLSKG